MIVRLMGEGQFEIDEEVAKGLNDLDEQAAQAVEAGDEGRLSELLRRMAEAVRANGARVPDEHLDASDAIVPPDDLSLDEARQLFEDEGLIPDLPAAS
jgi:chromosome condensin MukBEF complex kleisin-like MukF subunit